MKRITEYSSSAQNAGQYLIKMTGHCKEMYKKKAEIANDTNHNIGTE